MKSGSVGLYKGNPAQTGIDGLVTRAEMAVQGQWTHVNVIAASPRMGTAYTFESTIWDLRGRKLPLSGVKRTPGVNVADLYREPVVDLTPEQEELLWLSCNMAYFLDHHYPIRSLILDAVIYPTRKFWQTLGWVPFSGGPMTGVCSKFVGERIVQCGWNPFAVDPALLVPSDYATNPAWKDVA